MGLVKIIVSLEQFIFVDYELQIGVSFPPGLTQVYIIGPEMFGGEWWSTWPKHNISIEWDPTLSVLYLGEDFTQPPAANVSLENDLAHQNMVIGASVGAAAAVLVTASTIALIVYNKMMSASVNAADEFIKMDDLAKVAAEDGVSLVQPATSPAAAAARHTTDPSIPDHYKPINPEGTGYSSAMSSGAALASGSSAASAAAITKSAAHLTPVSFAELKRLKNLGSGSQGQVYLAMWNGVVCAVKEVSAGSDPNVLLAEAALMATLPEHRNIVSFYGVCMDAGHYSIISEFCPRGDLLAAMIKTEFWTSRDRQYP